MAFEPHGSADASHYMERLAKFREVDAERDALVTQILKDYEELKKKYDEREDDYKNEVASRRMWQGRASTCEQSLQRALTEQKQTSSSNNFVLCLIDGDGALFEDDLYNMGRDGGSEAAYRLHADIQSHLKSIYPDANVDDWSIIVQVILNQQGLASKLQNCGIIMNPNELAAFARAFGLAQPLFSFVDVGSGKERADHKIRETFRLYMRISQCKHVFFAPCSDNGYLPLLESYKRTSASRLTLIEARPAESGFIELGLQRITMPSVFRNENLPSGPGKAIPAVSALSAAMPVRTAPSMQAGTAPFVPKSSATSRAPSTDSIHSTQNSSWATVGKNGTSSKTISIAPKKNPARKFILLNAYDERLDVELPRTDPSAEARFAERVKKDGKCCNNYHLTGKCDAGEYCDYHHGEKFSPGELLVLKHKARSRSCPKGFACREMNCTFGHHCKYGHGCYSDACYFADTHGQDTTPAKRMFEDGSEEWIQAYLQKVAHA
ncbi:hypothetical protein AC579_6757 [Pseudocercospora musae]|uniref:C3H1-type domain-containing protein n=1 Tax=Pseudocercospora musae TaxID=113226 RepID=A0A139I2G3_9PEZI|nr:hypothetical protein AC579_6757 [Pseudocercospora musae]KXT08869.1 hypothetical protein AC579_6757 [Pseudocercospora musae]